MILFLIIISLSTCIGNNKDPSEAQKMVKQLVGDTLILPENKMVLYDDSLYNKNITKESETKLKIITFIQGDCRTCILNLTEWDQLFQYAKSKKEINILFYLYTSDLSHFRNALYIQDIHKYPLILDQNYDYINKNSLPFDIKTLQTFLLNSNNEVILVGNPIYSEELEKLYKREIEKRIGK